MTAECPPPTVLAAGILGCGVAHAQTTSRDTANQLLIQGKSRLDVGEYADAAASFEDVLDINDSAGETSDLKAIAGVFLCLSRAKNNQFQEARTACNGVLQMRDAPQQVKDQASKLLTKLN